MTIFHKLLNKLKSGKVLYTWLISYLLILLFPIIVSFVPYFFTEHILAEQIGKTDSISLASSRRFIDDAMDNIANTALEFIGNDTIENFSLWDNQLSAEQIYSYLNEQAVWSAFGPFNEYIKNLYAYFPESGLLYYDNHMDTPDMYFLSHYQREQNFNSVEWKNTILLSDKTGMLLLTNGNGNSKTVFYVASKQEPGSNRVQYNIIVEFHLKALMDNSGQTGNTFYLEFSDGSIIDTNLPERHPALSAVPPSDKAREIFHINNERYIVSQIKSESGPWFYKTITPEHSYHNAVIQSRIFTLVAALISILCGILFILLSIRSNNRPLKELVRNLSGSSATPSAIVNEYQYINDLFIKNMNEKERYAKRLFIQNNTLKQAILSDLIDGKINEKLSQEKQLHSVDIQWNGECYLVILFFLGDLDNLFFESQPDAEKAFRLAKLIVTNIATELIQQFYAIEIFQKNDLLLGIVNLQYSQCPQIAEQLHQIFEETNDLLRREFNFSILISISDIKNSLNELPDGYDEAILGIEYLLNMCNQQIIKYREIATEQPNENYPYSMGLEQQIINNAVMQHHDKNRALLTSLFQDCMNWNFPSIQMVRYFSSDLLGTFLKIAVNQRNDTLKDFLLSEEISGFIATHSTSRTLLMKLKEIAMHCINILSETSPKKAGDTIYDKVKLFVDEHYDNPNINVNEISNHFHINVSQLSTQFKKIYGIGLLNYIAQKRIEMAKILLTTTDMPVNQIAAKIGYGSQQTFIRVFSSAEKISPGKYRQRFLSDENKS